MNAITTAIREVWGLFVEDASFTVAILICLALAIFVIPQVVVGSVWRGPLFFLVVALALFENVHRSARK